MLAAGVDMAGRPVPLRAGAHRVKPVMMKPSSSMVLKPPPKERYLAKTEKSGSLSPGISLPRSGIS